ncbi:MAG: flagellar hook protein FlgE [Candidatus Hydrogenedentes bacterium]|nr:flagellar hook protein FlgE [Candidatus Hydrogenedentota bacterium]
MGTAIFTGVTGLKAHQRRIDVIAGNIANVNTTAYRGSRVLFEDLFSQTLEGARAAVGGFGGSNPSQVGLGVKLGAIDINQNQGSLLTTGVASDLAIQGAGFFILSDGSAQLYSRDGSFQLNANGVLIDPATGLKVQGLSADGAGNIDTNAPLTDLVIPVGGTAIVRATTSVNLVGNLDSNAAVGTTVTRSMQVYDSLGQARTIDVTYTKSAQVTVSGTPYNAWTWQATYTNDASVTTVVNNGVAPATILFDSNGQLFAEGTVTGGVFTARPATDPEISVTAAALGSPASFPATPFNFNVDFAKVTELSATSDISVSNQDGYPRGTLQSFNIGNGGVVNGVFSNGLTRVIGQVALANFSNPGGLSRDGNNMFRDTPASGTAQIGIPQTGGRGQVSGGVLEGSNVDLGDEFSNLIVTERGFQANARTITTADTLLQETVNLIR